MTATKKKPHKAHKPARAQTVKPRQHRLHVPPARGVQRLADGDVAGDGRPAVLARRLRAECRRPHELDRQAARRRGRLPAQHAAGRARRARPDARRQGARSDRRRHRPRARLGRPHGAHEQPAGRAHDVLLAPPLGQLARVRLADAAADEPERAAAQVRRPRRQPGRLLPRHGARGVQGPVDAALPERRVQRQGRPERELRPRVHGALHARREPRRSPARRTTARTTSRSSRSRSRAGTSTTRTRTTSRRCSTPAAGSTARSPCSASSATTTPTASSTWCSSQDGHAPYLVNKLWGEFMPTPPPTATLQKLSTDYVASGRKIKPLRARDPHRPAAVRVDRRAEHDQAAGRLRGRRAARASASASAPRGPPTTSTRWVRSPTSRRPWRAGRAASRGSTRTPHSRASASSADVIGNAPNGSPAKVVDVPNETPQAAFDRAFGAVGAPWMSAGTRAAIQDYAGRASVKASKDRIARQVMLRTLMLAGPDAQVM